VHGTTGRSAGQGLSNLQAVQTASVLRRLTKPCHERPLRCWRGVPTGRCPPAGSPYRDGIRPGNWPAQRPSPPPSGGVRRMPRTGTKREKDTKVGVYRGLAHTRHACAPGVDALLWPAAGRGQDDRAGTRCDPALPMRHLHLQESLVTSSEPALSRPRRVVRPPVQIWAPA
jgi:hypothetical protein